MSLHLIVPAPDTPVLPGRAVKAFGATGRTAGYDDDGYIRVELTCHDGDTRWFPFLPQELTYL